MRKYLIFLLVVIALFLGIVYAKLFARQAQYQQAVVASADSALVLRNFDQGKVRIVTADTKKITVDLKGSADDILKLLQSEGGSLEAIDFSGQGSDISGTITVPKGILLDVSLSDNGTLDINDGTGRRKIQGRNSFLIDTNNLNSFQVDKSGNLILDGWGSLIVWDDQKWNLLSDNTGNDGEAEGNAENTPPYCGIGSQSIRNYCCEMQKKGAGSPPCDGKSYWVFDNIARDCAHKCEMPDIVENLPPVVTSDCGVGVQTARNNCCALRYVGQYQGCIGSWSYNNASSSCEFVCSNSVPTEEEEGEGGSNDISYGDPVSDYCVTMQQSTDKDTCCNDALKNGLSSGPHPGYPDCIGTWLFDVEKGCQFKCAEYTEMMKILEELRQKAQNPQ